MSISADSSDWVTWRGAKKVTLPAGLANGSRVEVRGTLAAAGGPMTATFLEIEPGFSASEGEHVELEGIVTDFVSMSNFKVNGVQVDASALTGVTFANGMKVEIEGTMVGGVLVAAGTSEVEHESYLLLEGNVSAVNPATGVISLLAVTVHTTAATELRDSSAADIRMFGLSDIAVNDHVEIGGYQDAGGTIIATRLERKDASAQLAIQGLVTAATTATSLTILGLTVDTSATPANHFIDIDGTPYASAADFFAAVTLNKTVVKATGTAFSGTTLTATEVEIEKQLP